MNEASARRLRGALLRWYRARGRDLPWRKTRDPYAVLISELMLQQQTVVRVVPVYEAFLRAFPDVAALAAARRSEVLRIWSASGMNRQAIRAQEIARELVGRGGVLPPGDAELMRLPGVGRYTAAAVRCFAFGERVAMVETNIRRVLSRVVHGSDDALDVTTAWELAERLLPRRATDVYDWNQALMDLGATVCRAAAPRCGECPVSRVCSRATRSEDTVVRETRATYGVRPPRRHAGSTRQLRGSVVRYLARQPDGAALTAGELVRRVAREHAPPSNALMGETLGALVSAGVLSERKRPRRVARYALADG